MSDSRCRLSTVVADCLLTNTCCVRFITPKLGVHIVCPLPRRKRHLCTKSRKSIKHRYLTAPEDDCCTTLLHSPQGSKTRRVAAKRPAGNRFSRGSLGLRKCCTQCGGQTPGRYDLSRLLLSVGPVLVSVPGERRAVDEVSQTTRQPVVRLVSAGNRESATTHLPRLQRESGLPWHAVARRWSCPVACGGERAFRGLSTLSISWTSTRTRDFARPIALPAPPQQKALLIFFSFRKLSALTCQSLRRGANQREARKKLTIPRTKIN